MYLLAGVRPSWELVIVVDSAVLSPSFVLVYTPGLRAYSHLLHSYYVELLCAAWYQSCLRLVADRRTKLPETTPRNKSTITTIISL